MGARCPRSHATESGDWLRGGEDPEPCGRALTGTVLESGSDQTHSMSGVSFGPETVLHSAEDALVIEIAHIFAKFVQARGAKNKADAM